VFPELNLHQCLSRALEHKGFTDPTEVQSATIPAAMSGKDLLITAETGSGKTAAFLIPIMHQLLTDDAPKNGVRAVILTPTRELARQIEKHAKELARFSRLMVNVITGGEDFKFQRSTFRKNPEIIVATPGRLKEHLEKASVDFNDLEYLVLDEADRMLDMGFTEDVLAIAERCNSARQTLLYSATLDGRKLQHAIPLLLNAPQTIALASANQANANITQQMVLTDDEKHKSTLLLRTLEKAEFDKVVVFANTKAQTGKLSGWLRYKDIHCGVLHGDMTQDARNEEMSRMRNGKIRILIATDVAARGLDVKGIDLVINFDMPYSVEDFVHRTGRTGRAGTTGIAMTYVAARDWNMMATIERQAGVQFEHKTIKGLEAKYKGPAKVKSSGKIAGLKKRSDDKKKSKPKEKTKVRHRDIKNVGNRRKPNAEKGSEKATNTAKGPKASSKASSAKFGDGTGAFSFKKKTTDKPE